MCTKKKKKMKIATLSTLGIGKQICRAVTYSRTLDAAHLLIVCTKIYIAHTISCPTNLNK